MLDIGTGTGRFLEMMSPSEKKLVGLETSLSRVEVGEGSGAIVLPETIEEHAISNQYAYDLVAAFQILEHVTDVHSFLASCIDVLRDNGLLVLCVPNNASFIRFSSNFCLNAPPHHMGRWSHKSLNEIAAVFPLKPVRMDFEPLQDYHTSWYRSVLTERYLSNSRAMRLLSKALGFDAAIERYIAENRCSILGPAVAIMFKKQ